MHTGSILLTIGTFGILYGIAGFALPLAILFSLLILAIAR